VTARLTLALIVAVTLALLATQVNPYLGDYGDDAEFVILGQGLARGQGYAWVNSPDTPAHNRYPPGYPLVVAATMLLSGTAGSALSAIVPAKIVTAVTLFAALAALWHLARRRLADRWSIAVLALCALNPVVIRFAVQVMSDVPYVPIFLGTLVWADGAAVRRDDRSWIVLGALIALGAYARSIGLAAAAGLLAWAWLTQTRRGALLTTVTFIALMFPWWLRDAALAGGWRYLEELSAANYANPGEGAISAGGLVERALGNAGFILSKPGRFGLLGYGAALMGAAVLIAGAVRSARLAGGAAEWATAAVCVAVLIWPIRTGRYLLPVIPVFGLYAALGILAVRDRLRAARRPLLRSVGSHVELLGGLVAGLACLGFVLYAARGSAGNIRALSHSDSPATYFAERPEWSHYLQAAEWLHNNAQPSDVAMARRHFAIYVYSGHFADKYRFDTSDEEIAYLLSGSARKYVVEDGFDYLRGDFDPLPVALRRRGGDLRLRFETATPAEVRVWELVRP
jgi:hypothetical protein